MSRLTGNDLARFHAGDPESFRRLVEDYSSRLLAAALSYARDADDAHDLVQETWSRAYAKRVSYSGAGTILGWLYAICRNVCRSRARRAHHAIASADAVAVTLTPDVETERAELRRRLHDAIGQLPDRERDVVVLRMVEGRSTREAAAIMGCAEGTIKAALHHAVKKLQAAMEVWTR